MIERVNRNGTVVEQVVVGPNESVRIVRPSDGGTNATANGTETGTNGRLRPVDGSLRPANAARPPTDEAWS